MLIPIPGNIEVCDLSPGVYEIKFPDLKKIYIGMTTQCMAARFETHLESARKKKHPNKDLEKLILRALYEEERMVMDPLDKGIFDEKDLRQKEAERIMEVIEAGKYELLNIDIPTTIVDGKKLCTGCKKIKVVEKFFRDRATPSGLTSQCKACHSERYSELCYEISEDVLANGKKCTKCKKIKPAEEFSRRRTDRSGLRSQCKACISERYHKKRAKVLAQKNQKQYTLFPDISAHVSVDVTGTIVPIDT